MLYLFYIYSKIYTYYHITLLLIHTLIFVKYLCCSRTLPKTHYCDVGSLFKICLIRRFWFGNRNLTLRCAYSVPAHVQTFFDSVTQLLTSNSVFKVIQYLCCSVCSSKREKCSSSEWCNIYDHSFFSKQKTNNNMKV